MADEESSSKNDGDEDRFECGSHEVNNTETPDKAANVETRVFTSEEVNVNFAKKSLDYVVDLDDEVDAHSPSRIMRSPQSDFQNASAPTPVISNVISNMSDNEDSPLIYPVPSSEESSSTPINPQSFTDLNVESAEESLFPPNHSFGNRLDPRFDLDSSGRSGGNVSGDDHPRVSFQTSTIPELSSLHYGLESSSYDGSAHESLNSMDSTGLSDILSQDDPPRVRFLSKDNSKFSVKEDIETGKEGARGQRVWERSFSTRMPQSAGARRRRGLKKIGKKLVDPFWGPFHDENSSQSEHSSTSDARMSIRGRLMVKSMRVIEGLDEEPANKLKKESEMESDGNTQQYRLQAIRPNEPTARAFGLTPHIGIYEDAVSNRDNCEFCGVKPNLLVIGYFHWAFRSSFLAVIISAAGIFFLLTFLFALVIMGAGYRRPDCINVNGDPFGTGENFLDAYALSWQTFSTVGYGLIFPATSATHSNVKQCTFITLLTALESFVGFLFASIWGAIFFSKVTRVSSVAQVTFSDPLVVRYGSGVAVHNEDSDSEEDIHASDRYGGEDPEINHLVYDFVPSKLPCPILEFRLLNRLHNQSGGEIIDASMNIVACIDESQASDSLKNSLKKRRRRGKKGKGRGGSRSGSHRRGESNFSWVMPTQENVAKARASIHTLISSRRNQAMVEDPTGKFIPRKIFAKLELESQEHPFFKRVWIARHVLNHHSPLLRQEAKELIRLNGGNWPEELNNSEAVRASVMFDQILVSLSGTSNVDANSVYSQQVYDYADLCVGYRFCDMLYRQNDGTIGVDAELINDVKEQRGGGGEDLNARDECRSRDFRALMKDFIL